MEINCFFAQLLRMLGGGSLPPTRGGVAQLRCIKTSIKQSKDQDVFRFKCDIEKWIVLDVSLPNDVVFRVSASVKHIYCKLETTSEFYM